MFAEGKLDRVRKINEITGYPQWFFSLVDKKPDPEESTEFFHKFCSLLTRKEARENGAFNWPYKSESVGKSKSYPIPKANNIKIAA